MKFLKRVPDKEIERKMIPVLLDGSKIMSIVVQSDYQNLLRYSNIPLQEIPVAAEEEGEIRPPYFPIVEPFSIPTKMAQNKAGEKEEDFQKAIDLFNKGKWKEVIIILKKIISKNPEFVMARKILAAAYDKNGQRDLAIKEFQTVINLEPKNAENYFYLGMIYQVEGKEDLAAVNLERAVQLDPTKSKYKKQLSKIYYVMAYNRYKSFEIGPEAWQKMIEYLKKSIQANPKNADAHKLLGQIYEEIADVWKDQENKDQAKLYYEMAQTEYLKVLELNPKSFVAFYLVQVYYRLGKYDLAYQYLMKYLKDSQDPNVLDLKKQIEIKIKEKGETE